MIYCLFLLVQVTSAYSCKSMTAHWPLVIFFNQIDVSAYNAFVLWMMINPNWNRKKCQKRRMFLLELARELVQPLISRRKVLPHTPASASLVAEIQQGPSTSAAAPPRPPAVPLNPPRKRCSFCKTDSKVCTTCHKCGLSVCKMYRIVSCTSCH